jgi:hypothetical protein
VTNTSGGNSSDGSKFSTISSILYNEFPLISP